MALAREKHYRIKITAHFKKIWELLELRLYVVILLAL